MEVKPEATDSSPSDQLDTPALRELSARCGSGDVGRVFFSLSPTSLPR
jgi:hypothetical protein